MMDFPGIHGKLPSHGDFISRNVSQTFVRTWEDWLQQGITASQECLGEDWLNIYLISPVWRFVLSPGVVDQQVWAGIMIPCVDKVGRYYPLTMVQSWSASKLPTKLLVEESQWFEALEVLAQSALQDSLTADWLEEQFPGLAPKQMPFSPEPGCWEPAKPVSTRWQDPEQNPLQSYPLLVHSLLQQRWPCYSLWWSQGSERVDPGLMLTGYLPSPQSFTALMDGNWKKWGWNAPFGEILPLAIGANYCDNTNQRNESE